MLSSRRKITFQEVASWPDDGRRYEQYDGEVSEVPAPLPRHQLAGLQALYDQLRAHVAKQGGLVLISPIDIVFDETNMLQPDIVVFTAARAGLIDIDRVIRVPSGRPWRPARWHSSTGRDRWASLVPARAVG